MSQILFCYLVCLFARTGMGRIGLVHLEAITKAPGVKAVMISNPTISKAEVGSVEALQPHDRIVVVPDTVPTFDSF